MKKGRTARVNISLPRWKALFFSGLFLWVGSIACLITFSGSPEDLNTVSEKTTETATEEPTFTVETTVQIPTATPDATATAQALTENNLRIFDQFIEDNKNGNGDQITGLWVENVMALQVVYQPSSNPGFVSTVNNVATYFLYPWQKAGNHGILAHNYLAGRYFFNVRLGDIITLVFGDGNYLDFEVTSIKEYQALEPDSPYSNFIDLETGEQLSVNNVFIEVYMGDFHTTLQTCIASGVETEWGRSFTLAPPLY